VFYYSQAGNIITAANSERIEADSRKALSLDPRNAKGNYYLGKVLAQRREWEEAIRMFQRAYDIMPPFKDDIQRAMRLARKEKGKQRIEADRAEATEAWECVCLLLKKARVAGELSGEKAERVSAAVRGKFALELAAGEGGMDVEGQEKLEIPEVPEHLKCPLSWEPLLDPVVAPSGLTYEKAVILDHLRRGNKFEPVTREPLTADQLYPNKGVRDAVDIYAEEHPECF
jgi:STIP1 homology and U-box containing protein 1